MDEFINAKISPDSLITLFSQAPVALSLLMGENFVIESANQHILQLWGKSSTVIGMPLIEGLPEIRDQEFLSILKEVYTTGVPFRGNKVLCYLERHSRMEACYFDFIYSPVYDDKGKVNGVSVVATEVTSQVLSEMKLAESELRFKELLLNADFSTAIYRGEDLVIELANDRMIETWGKDKSVIGMPLEKALPELEGQPFIQLLQNVYKDGKTYAATEDRVDLVVDGKLQTFYYNFTYKPIRNLSGEIYAILNMAVDVTDMVESKERMRKNAEELSLSEAKYKNLSEAMPQIVWTASPEGEFTYFNERMEEYLGLNQHELQPRDVSSFIHPDDLPKILSVWRKASQHKTDFEVEHRAFDKKTGDYFWLLSRGVPDLGLNGEILQWVGSSTDINEFKILQKQKDTFLAIASHELKTPLTSMKIYAQVLEKALKKSGDEKNAAFARKMDEQIVKLTALIGDLLDVTKINSGKLGLNLSHFDFKNLVDEIVEEQQLSSRHKILNYSKPVGTVFADRSRIGQVITNLIGNAIKYSPEADEIIIETEICDNDIQFSVKDFGIGMPSDKADKVFEQYYRVSGDEQHTFPGLGLGLYIASQIVERSSGKIWVNSVLGKGSTFCFSLPKSDA